MREQGEGGRGEERRTTGEEIGRVGDQKIER